MSGAQPDRRRYFRINDTLGVAYRVLSAEEAKQGETEERPVDPRQIIAGYDQQIENLLGQLRPKDPLISDLIEALNQKLNSLLDQINLESDLVQRIAHKVQEVNISACGMAFVIEESLEPGTVLSLDLLLLPANLHVFTRGLVLDCSAVEAGVKAEGAEKEGAAKQVTDKEATEINGSYHVRLEFSAMEPQDQEALIQHIVQRQSHLIRTQREPLSVDLGDSPD